MLEQTIVKNAENKAKTIKQHKLKKGRLAKQIAKLKKTKILGKTIVIKYCSSIKSEAIWVKNNIYYNNIWRQCKIRV